MVQLEVQAAPAMSASSSSLSSSPSSSSPSSSSPSPRSTNGKIHDIAMRLAEVILPRELGMLGRYNGGLLAELAEVFAPDMDATEGTVVELAQRLWRPVALGYVGLLTSPPGTMLSTLDEGMDNGPIEVKVDMFWRCALRLHMTPTAQLESMSKSWDDDLELSTDEMCAPIEAGPSTAKRRSNMIAVILPSYSMVARTRKEAREVARRKSKIEARKAEGSAAAAAGTTKTHPQQTSTSSDAGASKPAELSHTAARHTYANYSKWDDFDVDAALDKAGVEEAEEEKQPRVASQGTMSEEAEQEEVKLLDAELKEKLKIPEIRRRMREAFGEANGAAPAGEDNSDISLDALRDALPDPI